MIIFEQVETGWVFGPESPKVSKRYSRLFNGITKEEVIYVGDSPGDITASRQAGIAAIVVAWAKSAEPGKKISGVKS